MPGEFQFAEKMLGNAMASAAEADGIHAETFSRALMTQLLKYYRDQGRTSADIISELEQHIRTIQDEGESVITRGC